MAAQPAAAPPAAAAAGSEAPAAHPVPPEDEPKGLERFVLAQEEGGTVRGARNGEPWAQAEAELKQGRKETHWIWYVFPQLLDPDRASSKMVCKYCITSRAEAVAYTRHPVLGERLLQAMRLARQAMGPRGPRQTVRTPEHVMDGKVDAKKLHHSATCFALAAKEAQDQRFTEATDAVLDAIVKWPYQDGIERLDPVMVQKWNECAE